MKLRKFHLKQHYNTKMFRNIFTQPSAFKNIQHTFNSIIKDKYNLKMQNI